MLWFMLACVSLLVCSGLVPEWLARCRLFHFAATCFCSIAYLLARGWKKHRETTLPSPYLQLVGNKREYHPIYCIPLFPTISFPYTVFPYSLLYNPPVSHPDSPKAMKDRPCFCARPKDGSPSASDALSLKVVVGASTSTFGVWGQGCLANFCLRA